MGFWEGFITRLKERHTRENSSTPSLLANQLPSFLHFNNPAELCEEVMLVAEATILGQPEKLVNESQESGKDRKGPESLVTWFRALWSPPGPEKWCPDSLPAISWQSGRDRPEVAQVNSQVAPLHCWARGVSS